MMPEAFLADTWNLTQYDRLQREREQPFFDLMALARVSSGLHRSEGADDRLSSCQASREAVVERVTGALLTEYARHPFFYPLTRILCW